MPRVFVVLLVLGLASCATETSSVHNPQDHGAPLAATYQDTIKAVMNRVLKDSESARIEYRQAPYKSWLRAGFLLENAGTVYGYTVPVWINAKNSFGGYAGFQEYKFFFHDNRLLAWKGESGVWIDLR